MKIPTHKSVINLTINIVVVLTVVLAVSANSAAGGGLW
jgi:hypothetical protein